MADLSNELRARRRGAGLSQAELARRIGVSRQTVAAIEAGRHVPSTAVALGLGRALHCSVEELFALSTSTRLRALGVDAGPDARVAVGRVGDRWVAHPIRESHRRADGVVTRVGPMRGEIEVETIGDLGQCEHNVFIAGCAPLLGLLADAARRPDRARASWVRADSTRALDLLAEGLVHVAGLHLADTSSVQGHRELVAERFPDQTMALVRLTRWRQGLGLRPGNPLGIRSVADAQRPDVRYLGRAPGSGAHTLMARSSREAGFDDVPSAVLEAADHAEMARLIRLGVADVGVLFEGAALDEGLEFIPLAEERFDLVVAADRLEQPAIAALLGELERREFRAQARHLAGYDLDAAGESETVAA